MNLDKRPIHINIVSLTINSLDEMRGFIILVLKNQHGALFFDLFWQL